MRLLAVCVASAVDVVTPRATAQQPGAALAQAVGLDMAAWWQPTAEGYFKHVSKAVILDAVGEFAPEHVIRLAKLKKADIASEAERLAEGTGWMPAIFRTEGPQQDGQDVATDDDAEVPEAAAMADAQPQAQALAAIRKRLSRPMSADWKPCAGLASWSAWPMDYGRCRMT